MLVKVHVAVALLPHIDLKFLRRPAVSSDSARNCAGRSSAPRPRPSRSRPWVPASRTGSRKAIRPNAHTYATLPPPPMANANVTTIKIPTKYFALMVKGNGIIMISVVPEQHAKRNQNCEHPAGGPDGRQQWIAQNMWVGQGYRSQCAPHASENSSMNRRLPHACSTWEPNIHKPSMFPNQCQNSKWILRHR